MNAQRGSHYVTYDVGWVTKTCPLCKQKAATGHGWLFKESPPTLPAQDERRPIGELFIHEDGEDCESVGR